MATIRKTIIATLAATTLFASGAAAATVLDKYKTNRGDTATVEIERIHKNRIAIQVAGKQVANPTIYVEDEQATYVPLRVVGDLVGAHVNYNSKTQTAEIKRVVDYCAAPIMNREDALAKGRAASPFGDLNKAFWEAR